MYQVQEYRIPGNNDGKGWHKVIESTSLDDCVEVACIFNRYTAHPTRVCEVNSSGELEVFLFYKDGKKKPLASDDIATS